MAYYEITIRLTRNQQKQLAVAIHEQVSTTIRFTAKQINEAGDHILVTKTQLGKLRLAKLSGRAVEITFSRRQSKMMASQIGSGILDSLKGFFNNAVSGVKNWWSGTKKPASIPLEQMTKQDRKVNKAHAMFDEWSSKPRGQQVRSENMEPKFDNFMRDHNQPNKKNYTSIPLQKVPDFNYDPNKYKPIQRQPKQPKQPIPVEAIKREMNLNELSRKMNQRNNPITKFANELDTTFDKLFY